MSELEKRTSEERKFLHDVSSPLTTLLLSLETAAEMLEQEGLAPDSRPVALVKKALGKINDISNMIRERREYIKKENGHV